MERIEALLFADVFEPKLKKDLFQFTELEGTGDSASPQVDVLDGCFRKWLV